MKLAEFFKSINQIDNIYSLIAAVVGVLALLIYFVPNEKWYNILGVFSKRKDKISTLVTHRIFTGASEVLDKVLELEFTSHGVYDEAKTRLLHELARIQIRVIKDRLNDMIVEPENESLSEQELIHKVITHKREVVEQYRSEAVTSFYDKYGVSKDDGEFLVDKYIKYRKFFNDGFDKQIENIVLNNKYSTYDKVSIVLELIYMSLQLIPKDAQIAMDEVNGRFKKYNR